MSFMVKSEVSSEHALYKLASTIYFRMSLLEFYLEHWNLMINAYFYFSSRVQLVIFTILLNLFCTL